MLENLRKHMEKKPIESRARRIILLACTAMYLAIGCSTPENEDSPDYILTGGKIITVDPEDRIAEALAIKGNIITAIGSTTEIEALAGTNTIHIPLKGKTVTPGLLDAHIHFGNNPWGKPNVIDLSYPYVKNIAEVKALIDAKAKEVPPGEWIQGVGWDEGKLEEQRLITAHDLDEVSQNHPLWLSHTTGHYGVANSVAFQRANISATTSNPPEGIIEKGADGNPTGVLKESAMNLIHRLLPPSSIKDIERGMAYMAKELNKEGMTAIKDPTLNDKTWQAYQNMLAADSLPIRVYGLWPGGKSVGYITGVIDKQLSLQPDTANERLISGGIKIFADGSGGARTAWLYDVWNKDVNGIDTGNVGFPNIPPDTLRAMINLAHAAGVHVSTHAIGDRTIDTVVTIYKDALALSPIKGLRHGIIHANIPTPYAIQTMKELQEKFDAGYPEPSATFTWWIGDTYAGNFGERAKRLNPFATFKKEGIIWANGSDYAVTPFPARYGIWAAIAREPALGNYGGDPFGRAESVDVKTALRAVTIWAAHQLFLDNKIGSLEVGKIADLAVWDRDVYTVPVGELKEMKCLMTILDGKVVFRDETFD